ncbi:protein FAR1-RELATED SEQUENCE 5-like [Rhizophagus irregularis DAOM 181602=DAOM 197198]|nr:protein FAR1-RELATED SEQUENCE 5-like [Rhizophagus irregularis DAOM 181602=DAOM 197198]
MFSNIIKATGIQPVVIITDSDPAVDAAICQVLPFTYSIHCTFHISQNLNKNLKKLLDSEYQSFIHDFYSCRNCIVENIFQQRFNKLIENYPKAKNYLEHLYKTKEYWAHCYIKHHFTGEMIASFRVESVNACLKRLLNNSNISLYVLMFEIHQ